MTPKKCLLVVAAASCFLAAFVIVFGSLSPSIVAQSTSHMASFAIERPRGEVHLSSSELTVVAGLCLWGLALAGLASNELAPTPEEARASVRIYNPTDDVA